jgi:hypothetical protein
MQKLQPPPPSSDGPDEGGRAQGSNERSKPVSPTANPRVGKRGEVLLNEGAIKVVQIGRGGPDGRALRAVLAYQCGTTGDGILSIPADLADPLFWKGSSPLVWLKYHPL